MTEKAEKMDAQHIKVIALSCLGGALEFYDFVVFVFFAKILSQLFFPSEDKLASLMATFAVFAVGYLVRPLGGVIFGHMGDTLGRKKTFALTVILMAVPTFLIGVLPTYQQWGITATILLVLLRLMQGLSVGGEIPGAVTFAAESVPDRYRGLTCGLIFFGINMGLLLGSFVSSLIVENLTLAQELSWGWRLPFLFGGVLGVVSFYLRKKLQESPIFEQMQAEQEKRRLPIVELVHQHPKKILQGLFLTGLGAVIITLLYLYLPTYLATTYQYPLELTLRLNSVAILLLSVGIVFFAYLSDRVGRKVVFAIGAALLIVITYPLFDLFQHHNNTYLVLAILAFTFASSMVVACYPCMLIELYPTSVRYSGYGLSYNLGFALFGGLTPLIVTTLIRVTGNDLAPSYYFIGIAAIAFLVVLTIKNVKKSLIT